MVSALWSASGWVINPHNSLRTKLNVLHQDATPNSAPIPNRRRLENAFDSMDKEQSGNQIYEHAKKINGLGTLLCSVNTGEAEVFLGDRFVNGDIS